MRALILPTTHAPPPWGDRPADWLVMGETVAQRTRGALTAAGCEIVADPTASAGTDAPTLVLPDDLLLSEEFVRDFLGVASTRPADRPLVAAIGPGHVSTALAGRAALPAGPDGSLPVPMLLWPPSQALPTDLPALLVAALGAEPVVVDPREQVREIPVPRAYADPGKETLTAAGSARMAMHLRHRTHRLQANRDWLGGEFVRNVGATPKWKLALKYLWQRFRPGPRRLFSKIGKGCTIHPTAIIEASKLGPGCDIGAHAIVRAAVLGAGVRVEDGTHVQLSVVEDKAVIGRQTSLFSCLVMEGAHSTQQMMQMSAIGRHSATTRASWFMDVRFGEGNVRVEAPPGEEGLLDSGNRFLGCDLGHGTIVGAGVLIAPGRMVPSNAKVIADPRAVASRLELGDLPMTDAGGAVLIVRDGRLEVE